MRYDIYTSHIDSIKRALIFLRQPIELLVKNGRCSRRGSWCSGIRSLSVRRSVSIDLPVMTPLITDAIKHAPLVLIQPYLCSYRNRHLARRRSRISLDPRRLPVASEYFCQIRWQPLVSRSVYYVENMQIHLILDSAVFVRFSLGGQSFDRLTECL